MSVTVFAISFSIIMAGIMVLLLTGKTEVQVAKAGKVTKFCPDRKRVSIGRISSKDSEGQPIDLADMVAMAVCGNSMIYYDIRDGQSIFVRPFNEKDKEGITTYPVLVFHIVNAPKGDAEFKLRKFVGYVNGNNWDGIYNQFRSRIRINEEEFKRQCAEKYAKFGMSAQGTLVLSETFDEDKKEIVYSLHPVNTIYGKVMYAA